MACFTEKLIMMSNFLANNREELIERCAAKVAIRPKRQPTARQLSSGIPLFIAQLQQTLEAEELHQFAESVRLSGGGGGAASAVSEMGIGALLHGTELLTLGYTVDQVVHDYGDLCQAITDLAEERDAPFAVAEFRSLNRCLDNAIGAAVSAFSMQRDASVAATHDADCNDRVSALLHELRSSLAAATYATAALELGNLPVSGSTGTVLKRSLAAMRSHIGGPSLDEVRTNSGSDS